MCVLDLGTKFTCIDVLILSVISNGKNGPKVGYDFYNRCANVLVSRKFNVVQVVCDPGRNGDYM